jgi:hypothetical protein
MTEANSGRHRRHVWIVPCLLLAPLVAGVVGVNKSFTRREAELRDLAGVVVQAELLRTHWSALEHDKDFQPVIAAMAREYGPAAAEYSWNVRLFHVAKAPESPPDMFEQTAIDRIRAGAPSVWTSGRNEGTRYVVPIAIRDSCIACHPVASPNETTALKPGDIIAFASVRSRPHEKS